MSVQQEMLIAFKAIIVSPFKDWSIWWMLSPVVILWVVIELYFGKHKHEKLGWNTALSNGVSLSWITISLMKFLFQDNRANFTWPKFSVVIVIMLYGLFIAYISFTHKFSAKATYLLADPSPIYFLSTVSVLWAYGSLDFTWWVLLDLIILYPVILGIFWFIGRFIPEAEEKPEEEPAEEESKEEDQGLGEDLGLEEPSTPKAPPPRMPVPPPRAPPPGIPPRRPMPPPGVPPGGPRPGIRRPPF